MMDLVVGGVVALMAAGIIAFVGAVILMARDVFKDSDNAT